MSRTLGIIGGSMSRTHTRTTVDWRAPRSTSQIAPRLQSVSTDQGQGDVQHGVLLILADRHFVDDEVIAGHGVHQ